MKKFIAFTVCLLLITGIFAGCGSAPQNSSNSTATTTSGTSVSETSTTATTQAEQPEQPVTIKMLGFKRMEEVNYLFDGFKKVDPNITIEYESLSADKIFDVLKTRLVGGVGPDIFQFYSPSDPLMQQFEDAGYIEDLSNEPYLSNLSDAIVQSMKMPDGKIVAIPTAEQMWGIYYNKDQFSKAGITDVPKTWPEFLAVCDRLKQAGFAPIGGGFKDGWTLSVLGLYIETNLMSESDLKAQEDKYNSGEMKYSNPTGYKYAMMQMVSDLASKGYFLNGSMGLNYDGGMQAYATGKATMLMMGPWTTAQALAVNPKLNMGVFTLPSNSNPVDQLLIRGGACDDWSINSASKPEVKAAAKKFFAYLLTKDANELYAKNTTQFPVVTGAQLKLDDPIAQAPMSDFNNYSNNINTLGSVTPPDKDQTAGYKAAEAKLAQAYSLILAKPNSKVADILADCDKAYAAGK